MNNIILFTALISFFIPLIFIFLVIIIPNKIMDFLGRVFVNFTYSSLMLIGSISYVFGTIFINDSSSNFISNFSSLICAVYLIIVFKLTNWFLLKIIPSNAIPVEERITAAYTSLFGAVLLGIVVSFRNKDVFGITMTVPSIALATILGFSISLESLLKNSDKTNYFKHLPKVVCEWIIQLGKKFIDTIKHKITIIINILLLTIIILLSCFSEKSIVNDVGTGIAIGSLIFFGVFLFVILFFNKQINKFFERFVINQSHK